MSSTGTVFSVPRPFHGKLPSKLLWYWRRPDWFWNPPINLSCGYVEYFLHLKPAAGWSWSQPPPSIKVKNAWSYTSSSMKLSYIGPELKKRQFFLLRISAMCVSKSVSLEYNYRKRIQLKVYKTGKTTNFAVVIYRFSY
jgi:hypothetical protein